MSAPTRTRGAPPRHERMDELVAASVDPHPRKTLRVEWIGEKSPIDDPVVAFNLLMKRYTPLQEAAVRRATQRCVSRTWGARLLENDDRRAKAVFRGLRRTYYFDREHGFVQDVDYHDVDVIMGSAVAHEFVVLDWQEPDAPDPLMLPPSVFDAMFALTSEKRLATDDPTIKRGDVLAAGKNVVA